MQDVHSNYHDTNGARNPFVEFAERARRLRRKAAATAVKPEDHLTFLRQLMANNVADGDLLTRVIEGVRPLLADATQPTKTRIRLLWAAAKHARKFGAADVVHNAFTALAVEAGLINKRGHWAGTDVRDNVRWHGAEDVAHVVTWALRGWNPFETGPLK
jgi:hypothetical protein